jgi:hypothetical protein
MSASFLRRLLCTAALAGGLLVLGGGAANAWEPSPDGATITQTQDATNTNTTDQTATANAETTQVNVNAPIAILSPGANNGDVDQSNTADTNATAGNSNTTDQSTTQDQDATTSSGCGSCGGGSVSQDQSGENTNDTYQDAEANATTNQYNVNAPISVLSPGANGSSCSNSCGGSGGDVNQSNDANTSAWAGNSNQTTQTVDQSQDATAAGSGFCGCESPSIEQSQTGTNDNKTDQNATANAETTQVNVNAPIAILSPGANNGDVNQSNQADTDATAYNGNSTDQSIWQDQDAVVRGDGCGTCHDGGGSISQDQTGENTNDTYQDATANASTEQKNFNVPVAILSPGANGGDVNQSNDATTTAWAGNSNETDQSIDQGQHAVIGGCGCGGAGSITQSQDGTNDNSTDQDATANATTEQKNYNVPIAILSPACGCHGGGDVNQSNDATTTSWAGNSNSTSQSVNQDQDGVVRGAHGCGGCQPHPCECEPDPCHNECEPDPCHSECEPNPCHSECEPHPCGCPHAGSIDQSQRGSNTNDTHQNAEANAHTYQKNENKPFSFLSPGANGGDVTQSNDATTTAWAGNWNDTLQSVDQRQFAAMRR